MVNEEDYKNALEVIKKCKNWVKDTIKNYANDDSFPNEKKLVFLSEQQNYYHRGGRKTYLILTRRGLTTMDFCGDGTRWTHDIFITEDPYCYAYNNTRQGTIDLAVVLVNHWDYIKHDVLATIEVHSSSVNHNSKLLKNFEV